MPDRDWAIAAGDVRSGSVKRVASAVAVVGGGAMALRLVHQDLNQLPVT